MIWNKAIGREIAWFTIALVADLAIVDDLLNEPCPN
jgi:hypothetical protein